MKSIVEIVRQHLEQELQQQDIAISCTGHILHLSRPGRYNIYMCGIMVTPEGQITIESRHRIPHQYFPAADSCFSYDISHYRLQDPQCLHKITQEIMKFIGAGGHQHTHSSETK